MSQIEVQNILMVDKLLNDLIETFDFEQKQETSNTIKPLQNSIIMNKNKINDNFEPTAERQTMGWNCEVCTFLNTNASYQCVMCYPPYPYQNDNYSYSEYSDNIDNFVDFDYDLNRKTLRTFTFTADKKKKRKKPKKKKIMPILPDINNEKKQKKQTKKKHVMNIENMNYKQYTKYVCEWYIRWSNKPNEIFPNYRNISGSVVSQKRINKAKQIVELLLKEESKKIIKAWKQFASKRYYEQRVHVTVDIEHAIKRVNSTRLQDDDDETYGEADEDCIWITESQLSDEGLVGTILHEALHFMTKLNGKEICEKDEHIVIKMLGDNEC